MTNWNEYPTDKVLSRSDELQGLSDQMLEYIASRVRCEPVYFGPGLWDLPPKRDKYTPWPPRHEAYPGQRADQDRYALGLKRRKGEALAVIQREQERRTRPEVRAAKKAREAEAEAARAEKRERKETQRQAALANAKAAWDAGQPERDRKEAERRARSEALTEELLALPPGAMANVVMGDREGFNERMKHYGKEASMAVYALLETNRRARNKVAEVLL